MKCLICGRKLMNPQSREIGYGPVCHKRKFGSSPHARRRDIEPPAGQAPDYNIPGQISMEDYLKELLGQ